MTDYDKSTIQRMFGVIEGVAMLLDKRYAEPILNSVRVIDETLKKEGECKNDSSEST